MSLARWYVLDAETTDLVAIHTDGNEQLSVMRFSQGEFSRPVTRRHLQGDPPSHNPPLLSADGALLAVGSHDNFIYLYTVSESGRKYSRYGKCTVSLHDRFTESKRRLTKYHCSLQVFLLNSVKLEFWSRLVLRDLVQIC